MIRSLLPVLALFFAGTTVAQTVAERIDSLRVAEGIPEIAYLVVSGDTVVDMAALGTHWKGGPPARLQDRFHLGSNTKALTALLAEDLIQQGTITLHTRFFDLFPELRKGADRAYADLDLQALLTFRGLVPSYTYTNERPRANELGSVPEEQRIALIRYFLKKPPATPADGLTASNLDYVMAGAMLERAAHNSYVELVRALGQRLDADLRIGPPARIDTTQPYGHVNGKILSGGRDAKLEWLLCAGNVNVDLPGYARILEEELRGVQGRSFLLPATAYERMLRGTPVFGEGWYHVDGSGTDTAPITAFWGKERFGLQPGVRGGPFSFNQGSAAGFSSQVRVYTLMGRAFAVFANDSSPQVSRALDGVMAILLERFAQ